ncbi:hypothetical protein [Lacinutrix himadriensis]|uniref:hypothetical protein n=1 Tax=Lacinutrix himadriensis TaxID=641549 RepID=UPI0006E468BF|nr:hypothetical protein [Lacinutrix himadriensis]
MKTFTNPLIKAVVLICLCFFSLNNLYSQVRVPFTQRTADDTPGQTVYSIKGDFTLIGNTNLTLQNYGTNTTNSNNTMIAVDVDGDSSTTNSSSANLNFSNENGAIEDCSNIIYAGLYWTGRTSSSAVTLAKRSVKFKHANQTTYEDVVADVNNIYFPGDNNMYAAYAEVTDIVKANGTGQYFTGNVEISTGNGGSTGYYGGWALVVVYENDLMEWRDVTVFDGYAYLVGSQTTSNQLDVSGFNAIQNGPVNVKLGVIAGEGDRGISGDYLEIWEDKDNDGVIDTSLIPLLDEWTPLSHSGNSTGNFFNSSIQTGGNTRNPNLTNNTGLDISMFYINNANNDIIDNGATNTSFRYGSIQDTYVIFNIAMAIDAFVPSLDGQIAINNINGDASVTEPYTINPGETVQFDIDIHNNGNEALENFLIQIPVPDTGVFVPGSIQSQVIAPANTTTSPYFDASFGTNGGIIWQFGDLPEAINLTDVLASLSFEVEASNNCEAFNPPNCSPIISLSSALMTGTGAVSQSPFFIKFNSGYQQAPCIAYPISEPIVISVIPSLEIDSAASNLTVECDGAGNTTAVNDWLATAGNASVVGDCIITWTNDFTGFSANQCGAAGSSTVIFTATDSCGNTTTTSALLTIEDNTPPDLSNCSVTDEILECNGTDNETIADNWNAANLLALQTCPVDDCNTSPTYTVVSNYNFDNLISTCGAGGTIEVIYTGSDDCGNEASITATLTLNDSIGPDLSNCSVTDEILECNGTDNQTIADNWNAANILDLQTCPVDDCNATATYTVVSNYDFANLISTCGAGGTIEVIYTGSDDCGNESSITATLTLNDSVGPDLSNCSVTDEILECSGTDNQTIADNWNAANILALQTCPVDDCNVTATYTVVSNYDFANLVSTCGSGGTIEVIYTGSDDCGNEASVTATLTLNDSVGPDLTACSVADETIECDGTNNETLANAWNAANILALQSCGTDACDTDAVFDVTSDYAFTNLAATCGAGGTILVTYIVSDDCDNETILTATLTLNDSIGPDLTACTVVDETIECDGTNNETIANDWNAANILALQSCGTDACDTDAVFDVTSDYTFTNLASTCGAGGTILVTYIVSDDCDNETILTATLTLNDSIGPDLTSCTVVDETIECDGTNNETIANDWNAANILALQSCGTDSCDTDAVFDVTSNYAFTNLVSTCGLGGTITVIYTVEDDCDNATTLTAILTLNDSIGPDLTVCADVTDTSVDCTADQNETIADAWHAANLLALESCGTDSCDADGLYTVTSDYDFNNLNVVCGPCGSLPVTYTVADDCGNTSEITVTLNFGDATGPDLISCNVVDETIECDGANNETLADTWNADNIAELQACAMILM